MTKAKELVEKPESELVELDYRDPEGAEAGAGPGEAKVKAFKGAGHPVSYWRQGAERGWEKQA